MATNIGRKHQRWETQPFKCWDHAKALRRRHTESVLEARAKGKKILEGSESVVQALPRIRQVMGPPQVAITQASNSKFNRENIAAAECRGFGRPLCGYRRGFYGVMLRGMDLSGGPFPLRDFALTAPAPCDDHAKNSGPIADFQHIPQWQRDAPRYMGPPDAKRDAQMAEYVVQDTLELIEWLEKSSGMEFDDELFYDTVVIEMTFHKLAGEALCLNQNIPAPLDMKSLYSFYTLGGLVKSEWKETESFWKELRDELKWRVENHIAAIPTERFRFMEHEPPPWHYLRYLRYLETYGAVGLGSHYTFTIGSPYDMLPDGSWAPRKTPLDLGYPMRNREEIVRARAAHFRPVGSIRMTDVGRDANQFLSFSKAFHADGAVMPLHLSGVGCVWGMRELALGVQQAGLKILHYECSQPGDRNNLDENRMLDQIDAWMQSQGLERLEEE